MKFASGRIMPSSNSPLLKKIPRKKASAYTTRSSSDGRAKMGKRGRPNRNGLQPAWMWYRATIVVHAFNEARKNGEKYEAAISAAIDAVKARHPEMRIGPRRVKEILAQWQPAGSSTVLIVTKPPDAELESLEMQQTFRWLGFPEGKKMTCYRVGEGPRPVYPRANQAG